MKTQIISSKKRGFTLMELMVAMAITTIIVTVLVSITSIALDTWNRSRAELRASRQAKSMVDSMARDFEALVTRRGNTNEWLSAISAQTMPGDRLLSTSASKLIFFTAATDRYNGQIGVTGVDNGGDVSCVAYELEYKDPIGGNSGKFDTFILNRKLVDPKEAFEKLLGKDELETAFTSVSGNVNDSTNFVCENIFQFTVTFHVQVAQTVSGTTTLINVPVTVGKSSSGQITKEFRIKGSGVIADISGGSVTSDQLKAGRVTAVEISLTVVSDFGIDQLRTRTFTGSQQSEFLAKNSYQYSKMVQLPSM
ncbi:MAG: prepilin-type N-terminal cleavage/methylation domain-containing protein [Akkermansiaceae bacterium]